MGKITLIFDVDWAPDFVLEYVSHYLIENNIKSTWLITYESPLIEKLKSKYKFEYYKNSSINLLEGAKASLNLRQDQIQKIFDTKKILMV